MNIVLEVKGNRAVLLDNNGRMQIVRNKNYSVGQSVAYHKTSIAYKACAVAACAAAVFIFCTAGYHSYFTTEAYLSIDINPSIQLEVNRFERVISAEAFNDEGNMILDSIRLKNGNIKTAIEKIIDAAKENGYITESDNGVILDISSEKTDIIDKVASIIEEYADKNVDIVVEQSTSEDVETAKSLNVSIGRAKALREYSELFGGAVEENQESLKESSVKELHEKNQQKSEEKTDNKGSEDAQQPKDTAEIKEKAAEKAEKENEKKAKTEQKTSEEVRKEAQNKTEETQKETEKQAENAAKEAEKQAEETAKAAEKQAEQAVKEAEQAAKETKKQAEETAKEAEKQAEERQKEIEKSKESGEDKNK